MTQRTQRHADEQLEGQCTNPYHQAGHLVGGLDHDLKGNHGGRTCTAMPMVVLADSREKISSTGFNRMNAPVGLTFL
ncbi:MAG: hypothetical protein OXM02_02110 [Bacteroidota bacterium]|nr:hypothetical protein [Bacteroidota bacterium]